ncbi:DedA family protein, partial [Klebsiella pneumoniae]|nr:DedA family protein [Klebsiella pneumoniae]
MEWVNALMSHFALHPFSLWSLLFGIAFAKSTFLISAVLPPASVMLVAVISVGKATIAPWEAGIAVMIGAWCGTIVNYHLGMMMGHLP